MKKMRLFTPGPTMVPEDVMLEMAKPMEHHRTGEFKELFKQLNADLQWLFCTTGPCITITGSGTAAGEAGIVACCTPGKKALCIRTGKFGERWSEICAAFSLPHIDLDVEWGHAVDPGDVDRRLAADKSIDTVVVVHSETSTASINDVRRLAEVTRRHDALLLIDGITAVGAIPFKMDEWGVDVCWTGSQKAFMLPPGLAFIAVSDRAWQRIEQVKSPAYYNSLKAYRKALEKTDVPYTPNVSLVRGAWYVLRKLRERGLEAVWAETALLAKATRAATVAMKLSVFAADPVDSVTAINVPPNIDEGKLRKTMRSQHGMQIAGGQGHLTGKIIRVSHMGYVDAFDTLAVIAALEQTLASMGHSFTLGAGLTAAQRVFVEER